MAGLVVVGSGSGAQRQHQLGGPDRGEGWQARERRRQLEGAEGGAHDKEAEEEEEEERKQQLRQQERMMRQRQLAGRSLMEKGWYMEITRTIM